jgi:hypothetical protein
LKVYMAARFSRRDELREYVPFLVNLGIDVTSRWLHEVGPLDGKMSNHTARFLGDTALVDYEDIERADAILLFSEDPLVGFVRGGRHVEFGIALGLGKNVYVIGPKENIFHYMPGVEHFASLEAFGCAKGVTSESFANRLD